jgi:hypothetical protein
MADLPDSRRCWYGETTVIGPAVVADEFPAMCRKVRRVGTHFIVESADCIEAGATATDVKLNER